MKLKFLIHTPSQAFIHKSWQMGKEIPFTSNARSAKEWDNLGDAINVMNKLKDDGLLDTPEILARPIL